MGTARVPRALSQRNQTAPRAAALCGIQQRRMIIGQRRGGRCGTLRPGRGVRGVEGKRSGEWADEYAAALRSIYAMQSASCICIESAPVVWNLLESVRAARDAAERPHERGADRARRAGACVRDWNIYGGKRKGESGGRCVC